MSSTFEVDVTAYTYNNDVIEKIEVTIGNTSQCEKLEVYLRGGSMDFFSDSTITKISDEKWIADFLPPDPDFFNNKEIFCNGSVGSEKIAVACMHASPCHHIWGFV